MFPVQEFGATVRTAIDPDPDPDPARADGSGMREEHSAY
jgi:hypothetical protein